jgi:hypothetical protein
LRTSLPRRRPKKPKIESFDKSCATRMECVFRGTLAI